MPLGGPGAPTRDVARDGAHDFDGGIGVWDTRLSVLRRPLSDDAEWVDYQGVSLVTGIWGRAASLVQLDATGPAGDLHALSLRLYDTASATWTLNFASLGSGEVAPPTTGAFDGAGRGEFRSRETLGDRVVDVRFVITQQDPDTWHYEQAFSPDGGATWETNWIAIDTRRST